MFEMIGLVFAAIFLLSVGCMGGAIFTLFAWFLFRRIGLAAPRKYLLSAFCLPVIGALYICIFALLWPTLVPAAHESVFGDISEPLPNGFTLTGLAKMADYDYITAPPWFKPRTLYPNQIGQIAVEGPIVYASESRPFGAPKKPNDEQAFFLLNTATGEVRLFATLGAMEGSAGHAITLVPTGSYRTDEPAIVRLRHIGNFLMLAPPASACLLYLVTLLQIRKLLIRHPPQ